MTEDSAKGVASGDDTKGVTSEEAPSNMAILDKLQMLMAQQYRQFEHVTQMLEETSRGMSALREQVAGLSGQVTELSGRVMEQSNGKHPPSPQPPPAIFAPSRDMQDRAARLLGLARPVMMDIETVDRIADNSEGQMAQALSSEVEQPTTEGGEGGEVEQPATEGGEADHSAAAGEELAAPSTEFPTSLAGVSGESSPAAEGEELAAQPSPAPDSASISAPAPSPLRMIPSDLATALNVPKICSEVDLRRAVVAFGEERLQRSSVTFLKSLCLRTNGINYISPKPRTVQAIMQWAQQQQSGAERSQPEAAPVVEDGEKGEEDETAAVEEGKECEAAAVEEGEKCEEDETAAAAPVVDNEVVHSDEGEKGETAAAVEEGEGADE